MSHSHGNHSAEEKVAAVAGEVGQGSKLDRARRCHGLQRRLHVQIEAAIGHQELLSLELLQREGRAPIQRIVLRQDCVHPVAVERRPIAAAGIFMICTACIRTLTVPHPLLLILAL